MKAPVFNKQVSIRKFLNEYGVKTKPKETVVVSLAKPCPGLRL